MNTKVEANELIDKLSEKIAELTVQISILTLQNEKLSVALEESEKDYDEPAEVYQSEITE